MVYLDSSAVVKLVVEEAESAALRRFLLRHPARSSCALVRVEVPRAVAARGASAVENARRVIGTLDLVLLDDALLDAAGDLVGDLPSLDAVHVSAARQLGEDLDYLVTYDHRMAAAAEAFGMTVADPS